MKLAVKNIFMATVIFLFFGSHINAQTEQNDSENAFKPEKGDWGMVLNLSGLIDNIQLSNFNDSIGNNTILFKHYRKPDLVYRMGLGIGVINKKFSNEDSISISQQLLSRDSVYKRSTYSFSFGLEKHLGNSKRLDPYIGAQAIIGLIGKTKIEVDSKTTGNTGTATQDRDFVQDGGSMFGIHLIGGFNYFIAQRFSLGAEYMLGYNFTKVGGNFSDTVIDTPVNGSSTSTLEKGEASVRTSTINPSGSAAITLSYFF